MDEIDYEEVQLIEIIDQNLTELFREQYERDINENMTKDTTIEEREWALKRYIGFWEDQKITDEDQQEDKDERPNYVIDIHNKVCDYNIMELKAIGRKFNIVI